MKKITQRLTKQNDSSWEEQLLNSAIYFIDKDELYFGSNIEWKIKDVRKFLYQLEKSGVQNLSIPNDTTIKFTLPKANNKAVEALLLVMTADRLPCGINYDKKNKSITLNYDW